MDGLVEECHSSGTQKMRKARAMASASVK